MRVLLTFAVWREGKDYISECLELGVASCGDTEEEALEAIQDATRGYIETL